MRWDGMEWWSWAWASTPLRAPAPRRLLSPTPAITHVRRDRVGRKGRELIDEGDGEVGLQVRYDFAWGGRGISGVGAGSAHLTPAAKAGQDASRRGVDVAARTAALALLLLLGFQQLHARLVFGAGQVGVGPPGAGMDGGRVVGGGGRV